MFKNKTLLITGGTGSFGNAVLKKFIDSEIGEIRIFSRDEKKQDDMRRKFQNNKIKYFIGDVRDVRSIDQVMSGFCLPCCCFKTSSLLRVLPYGSSKNKYNWY